MKVTILTKFLKLKQTFTISRGSKVESEVVYLRIQDQGAEGWGEATPNVRYKESAARAVGTLARLVDQFPEPLTDPLQWLAELGPVAEGEYAARACLDLALVDWWARQQGKPLYELWGFDPQAITPTSYTISIDKPEAMAKRVKQAVNFHKLKVKLGGPDDRAMIRAIRAVSDQSIRVDANEGWLDREQAAREIEWLAGNGVELVEQPMPSSQQEDMIWLKQRSVLPLIADESFVPGGDLKGLAEGFHGINIKLMKAGGSQPALQALREARGLGMKVMIGCMVESSVGIAAALHMAGGADYIDLDGNLLIGNDPFDGLSLKEGIPYPGQAPGLGIRPNRNLFAPSQFLK
jgi:L-alanine-DL-glutamate epimerase-like enolase superfamily enzyme